MIGWLSGTVFAREPIAGEVILDVGGVGYQIAVSLQTLAAVPECGRPCALWIHTHVREDALALFGFADPIERRAFRLLLGVPQVGPKLAIGVLGGFPLAELLAAIEGEQRTLLERIPGVGKRTAERILLDLKDKVGVLRDQLGSGRAPSQPVTPDGSSFADDARAVLVNLGWKVKDVDAALTKVDDGEQPSLDALVRRALAQLMSRP
ncbi:MAG: Holliday junction branch migration protein RuvA [Deltaproteobacteria bacterium]|nr:Holliday junction branch migration protein RuvA [Deltaproteobacteria bacterium]MBK8236600.1 Holliday junction branch migration protein RuvA [Deltaproteobacteria bacterium]MBK8717775.1 Holliday junction branch migration protein RuvA [Deltaproteobacteria bacterium]MBP7288825.1 Holliday junction branch migration protein RuvA [Nannocystaceae bacterium]